MSYTTILHVFPNNKVECGIKLKNAWGSAPVVWDALCQKYLGFEPLRYVSKDLSGLWNLWRDNSVPLHNRAVLMMTFDRAYVSKTDYQRAADDIRKFLRDFPPDQKSVNHWNFIADFFSHNPEVPAIGFWCTSVSDNPFNGQYNDETEEYDAPDWNECRDIYRHLDGVTS